MGQKVVFSTNCGIRVQVKLALESPRLPFLFLVNKGYGGPRPSWFVPSFHLPPLCWNQTDPFTRSLPAPFFPTSMPLLVLFPHPGCPSLCLWRLPRYLCFRSQPPATFPFRSAPTLLAMSRCKWEMAWGPIRCHRHKELWQTWLIVLLCSGKQQAQLIHYSPRLPCS